ncbi:hypothetical protein [Stackebrandtia soli]|uniref:hypothetical protein n=1 Tax=Stackebrandtia soli TaxID=1892856 RepID=UPI0039E78F72
MPIYDPTHCPIGPTEQRPAERAAEPSAVERGTTTTRTYALAPSRPSRVPVPPNDSTTPAPLVAGGAVHTGIGRPDDPPRPLGLFKLGHRLITATYVGDGEARLDLLGAGGTVASPVGSVAGINTAVPLLFPHPAQRYWVSEPAIVWFLTRTTTDRYRTTTVAPPEPTGAPEPARPPVDAVPQLACGPTDPDPTPATGSPRAGRTEART